MENDGASKYWNSTPKEVLDIYYTLQEKFADEYKSKIEVSFEQEAKALESITDPYERERLQAAHAVTAKYIADGSLEGDANDYGFRMVAERDPELYEIADGMNCKIEYEFQTGRLFEKKLRETCDLTDSLRIEFDNARRILADHQGKKPAILENVISLGRSGNAWKSGDKALRLAAVDAENRHREQTEYAASALSISDAREYAEKRMEKDFPETTVQYKQFERKRIENGIRNDPVLAYEGEVRKYAAEIDKLDSSLWNNRRGGAPDALEWARSRVEEVCPALAEAYRAGLDDEWRIKNRERLEKVREQSPDSAVEKGVER